jgi:lysyl-tRNA synthetase class 2
MSLKNKYILTLQQLFELKKVSAVPERVAAGRLFFIDNAMGLCDATGAIFPITLSENLKDRPLNHGDNITFKCKIIINSPEKNTSSTYNESVSFQLVDILQHNPCKAEWLNAVIPNPLPDKQFLQISHYPNLHEAKFFNSATADRAKLIKQRNRGLCRVKQFFCNRGFIYIDTPTLVPSGGIEEYLHPFKTHYTDHRGKVWPLELPTSPEFALKKIMTEGFEKVFQLSRAYRNNGEVSQLHEPEFVMLEWYRSQSKLTDIMLDTEKLVTTLAEFLGSAKDIPKQWPRFRVDQLFFNILSIRLEEVQERNSFLKIAQPHSPSITDHDDWNTIFCKLFMEKIEPFLTKQKACFVTHYPIQMGALAQAESTRIINKTSTESVFVERMEAFLYGIEICNGYQELNDCDILTARFQKTLSARSELAADPLFENAMKFGMPSCSGNALGIDRLLAILLEQPSISQLYAIPFLSQFPKNTVAWE